jgi:hypothetical protein
MKGQENEAGFKAKVTLEAVKGEKVVSQLLEGMGLIPTG